MHFWDSFGFRPWSLDFPLRIPPDSQKCLLINKYKKYIFCQLPSLSLSLTSQGDIIFHREGGLGGEFLIRVGLLLQGEGRAIFFPWTQKGGFFFLFAQAKKWTTHDHKQTGALPVNVIASLRRYCISSNRSLPLFFLRSGHGLQLDYMF